MVFMKRSGVGARGVLHASLASTLAVGLSVSLAPVVHATEIEDLIAQLEDVSQQASAKNEEVKALEIAIADNEFKLAQASAQVEDAQAAVQAAQASLNELKESSGALANAAINGTASNDLDGLINSEELAESTQLLNDLKSSNAESTDLVYSVLEQAQEAQEDASRALAVETFRKDELAFQHEQVLKEQAELSRVSDDLQAQVDALNADQMIAWVNKNNPISEIEVQEIVQELPVPVAEIISNPVEVPAIDEISPVDLPASVTGPANRVVNHVNEALTSDDSDGFSSSPSSANNGAVSAALSKVGAPYQWGATGPDSFDCSGLMVWAFQQIGKAIPRTSYAQVGSGTSIPANLASLVPGDIIAYYSGASHVGMYIGDGKIVHASDYGIPVQVVAWDSMPVYGATRY